MTPARHQFRFRIQCRWYEIPAYMQEELVAYVEDGRPPGSFLLAVLSNDLKGALDKADEFNIMQLPAYAAYMYNNMPIDASGSRQKVAAWIAVKAAERAKGAKESEDVRP